MSMEKKSTNKRHRETLEQLEELEKRQLERKKRREKLKEPMKDDEIDFALDKFYDNDMNDLY